MRRLVFMRRLLLLVPVLILLSAAPKEREETLTRELISIQILEVSGLDLTREFFFENFDVLEDLGEIIVTRPKAFDHDLLEESGIPFEVAPIPKGPGDLFVVSLKGIEKRTLEEAALVLYSGREIAIVFTDAAGSVRLERKVPHFGLTRGIRRLDQTVWPQVPSFTPPAGWVKGARSADPRIQAMVNQVSQANLQSVVQDLENMGERKAGSGAFIAETYLVNSFNAIGNLAVSTHHFSASYSDNVIAELPGVVDPSLIYVVGGHYDSTSYSGPAPGADDNASGTSAVREIARILSQHQFKYTIRFIAFSAEELGLIGSDAYCDLLVSQGANVGAMINQDMNCYRAAGDTSDVDFVTNYSSTTLINFCKDMYTTYVPSLGIKQGSLSGGTSDHQSFTQHGYAACFPFEDLDKYSPYIHSSNDLIGPSANDFALAEMITQGVLAAIATLASPVDLDIQHTPLSDTGNGTGPYPVEADVSSYIGSNVAKVTLNYDTGTGFIAKEMVFTGTGNTYLSSIPGLALSENVRYYIEAEDDQANTERLPDALEAEYFEFFVGHFTDLFADDFEISDNGWTHNGTGQDDWMRDVPTGSGGYDPSSAFSGTKVWGNDLGPSGYNGNYQPNVDNWLESPSIDCSGQTGVVLRYRRWLTVEEGNDDQARILVNSNPVYENPKVGDLIDTSWVLHTVDLSAFANNNPDVKIRFTLTTDNSVEMGGWTLDDLHVGTTADPDLYPLAASEIYVPLSTGGAITLLLDGDATLGGRTYMVAASASGTDPGTPIGPITLPLNWDFLTNFVIANLNSPTFTNFAGQLDLTGGASAAFNVPAGADPGLVGLTFHFAWITLKPIDFTSNAVGVLFVP